MVKGMGEGLWRRLRLRNCEVDLDGFTSKMRSNRKLVEQAKGDLYFNCWVCGARSARTWMGISHHSIHLYLPGASHFIYPKACSSYFLTSL